MPTARSPYNGRAVGILRAPAHNQLPLPSLPVYPTLATAKEGGKLAKGAIQPSETQGTRTKSSKENTNSLLFSLSFPKKFVPLPLHRAERLGQRHRGNIEYSYSILTVQHLKMSDQHYREPRNVSTSVVYRRTTSFHFAVRVKIFGRTLIPVVEVIWKLVRFLCALTSTWLQIVIV